MPSSASRLSLLALFCATSALQAAELSDPLAFPPAPAFEGQTQAPTVTEATAVDSEVVMSGLQSPRALLALPEGGLLVVQGDGQAWHLDENGEATEVSGMPAVRSLGGRSLNDAVLDARFEENRLVYLTYLAPPPGEQGGPMSQADARQAADAGELFQRPVLARARLSEDGLQLRDVEEIAGIHGRRLRSAPDGSLYVTMMGHGASRPEVQDMTTLTGKVLRLNSDGRVPADNPFVGQVNVRGEIYTVGHRDPDGIALHPVTGDVWTIEHGPMGGDELNRLQPGRNYGWPAITYGREYSGEVISGTQAPGLEQPRYFWFPSVAPSSLHFYQGDRFPEWQGSVLLGTMSPTQGKFLQRLVLEGERVVAEERILVENDRRVRAVTEGSDGSVYVLTDSEANDELQRHFDGEVLRLLPVR